MKRLVRACLMAVVFLGSMAGPVPTSITHAQDVPTCSLQVPQLNAVQVAAPPDGMDPAQAAFLGAWEGNWETASFPPLPSRLIVDRLDATTGTGFYAWGDDGVNTHPGSGRMNFQVDGRSLRSGTSIKFTFTISEDGTAVDGVRETDRGLVSRITMTRCTLAAMAPAAAQAPASQPTDAPPCTLNEKFAPVSGQTGKSFAELLTAPATSAAQAKFLGAWQGSMDGETVRLVVFSTNRVQYTWDSMNAGDDAQAYRTFQVDASGTLSWNSGQAFKYTATRQDDGTLKLHLTRENGSEAEGALSACKV